MGFDHLGFHKMGPFFMRTTLVLAADNQINLYSNSGIVHCFYCNHVRRISMASSAHSLAAAAAAAAAAVCVIASASRQATLPSYSSSTLHSLSSLRSKPRELSLRSVPLKGGAKAQSKEGEVSEVGGDAFSNVKHLLLPVIDRNPYLSEGTRQAAATTTSLAKKYGADITVVVIDEEKRESSTEHESQVSNIRWHLSQGGFSEFKLLERLGEGKKATAIIGEVADELRMELVVMSMEAIHSKYIDANLLAEFIPCPVLLLPL